MLELLLAKSDLKYLVRGWVPDCAAGECRVPDFNGESYLEFPTLDNVAKFADIEVSSL